MKSKDVFYIIIAAVIFSITGIIAFKELMPKNQTEVQVEVATPIEADFDQNALRQVTDQSKAKNFVPVVDLNNGLNNDKPFNPI